MLSFHDLKIAPLMKRRDFFTLSRKTSVALAPQQTSAILSGLEAYAGVWEMPQVVHLLRRTMFGAKQEDVKYFLTKTMDEAVDELLQTAPAPAPPINNYNRGGFEDPEVPFGETWINAAYNNDWEGSRISSLKGWWLQNIFNQKRSIEEKMILFWHNHIPTQFWGVFFGRWSYQYLTTIRNHAMGDFKDLIREMTLDPGMLHYLNGQYNGKWEPDENYARELQELFCIGKGPNANYTEQDVQAAARVLTGWRVNYADDSIYFDEFAHDTEDKVFSSFYGTSIQGRSGQAGKEELEDLLNMLLANEECALFICRKLYRFFVADEIDETVEMNVIEPLATIYRDNNYHIAPVLSKLFRSQYFYDALTLAVMLKAPNDFLMGMFRELRMTYPESTDLSNAYEVGGTLGYIGMILQQELGDPPNVAGWPAYYQLPVYDKSWITTDSLPKRGQILDWFLFAGISTDDDTFNSIIDVVKVVENLENPADPNALIEEVVTWLLGLPPSDAFKSALKAALLSGQSDDSYWTEAWVNYTTTGSDMAYQTVYSRLQLFFYYLLHLEEHQLS